jgi:hypothetical protein
MAQCFHVGHAKGDDMRNVKGKTCKALKFAKKKILFDSVNPFKPLILIRRTPTLEIRMIILKVIKVK